MVILSWERLFLFYLSLYIATDYRNYSLLNCVNIYTPQKYSVTHSCIEMKLKNSWSVTHLGVVTGLLSLNMYIVYVFFTFHHHGCFFLICALIKIHWYLHNGNNKSPYRHCSPSAVLSWVTVLCWLQLLFGPRLTCPAGFVLLPALEEDCLCCSAIPVTQSRWRKI